MVRLSCQNISQFSEQVDEAWQINGDEIDFGNFVCIGNGSISTVFKASFRGNMVAAKTARVVDVFRGHADGSSAPVKSYSYDLIEELKIVSRGLKNPFIVEFYGAGLADLNGERPVLLYEYMSGGSAEHFIEEQIKLRGSGVWQPPRKSALSWCQQLCSAVVFLHEMALAHRDIKPANLLMDKDNKNVKLADFSLVTSLDQAGTDISGVPSVAGSLRYMAPEVSGRLRYPLDKSDVFSTAMTCYFLIFGRKPFDDLDARRAHLAASQGQRPFLPSKEQELGMVLGIAWDMLPSTRPSAQALTKQMDLLLAKSKDVSWAVRLSKSAKQLVSFKAKKGADDEVAHEAGEDAFSRMLSQDIPRIGSTKSRSRADATGWRTWNSEKNLGKGLIGGNSPLRLSRISIESAPAARGSRFSTESATSRASSSFRRLWSSKSLGIAM